MRSYDVVHDLRLIGLKDGKVLLLCLEGYSTVRNGEPRYDYTDSIFEIEKYKEFVENIRSKKSYTDWDLVLNGEYVSYQEYASRLDQLLDNIESFDELLSKKIVRIAKHVGFRVIEPDRKEMSKSEFREYAKRCDEEGILYTYKLHVVPVVDEFDIIDAYENKQMVTFFSIEQEQRLEVQKRTGCWPTNCRKGA